MTINKLEMIELCTARIKGNEKLNFSEKDTDKAIRNMFTEIIGTDKITKKLYRRHAVEIFEIIEQVVDQTIVDSELRRNAFFNQFVEIKNFADGDTNSFFIPNNSELVVSKISRGNWTIEKQRVDQGKNITLPMSTYGIGVYTEFVSFMAGRIDFPALIAKIAIAFEKFYAQLAYDTFVTALSGLPTPFKYTGAYSEDKIAGLVSAVEASNGATATIIGTKAGLAKLQATTLTGGLLSDSMKEEVNRNGFLSVWKNTLCMELAQGFKAGKLVKADGTPDFIFDDSQLFVVTGGEKPVKLYYEGSEMSRSVADPTVNEDMTLEETLVINLGSGIAYNKLFGSIKLA